MNVTTRVALDAVFNPTSIVAVGASADPVRLAGRPLRYLAAHDYSGQLFAVNPKYDSICGRPCYPSIDAVPQACDLALITLPANALVEAVRACGRAGTKACVIYSSIPSELHEEVAAGLSAAVAETGIRVIGPNCNGVFNVRDRIAMSLSSAMMERSEYVEGGVALVGQSGGAMSSVFSQGQEHGVGFSHYMATGNEVDLSLEHAVAYLLQRDDVDVVAAFVETFRHPDVLIDAARDARARGKAIVVLRAGRSQRAAEIAVSHTGAMTGSAMHEAAFLDDLGVISVGDLRGLWGAAAALGVRKRVRDGGLAVVTSSGGIAALVADLAADAGVPLAALSAGTVAAIKERLHLADVHNPLDLTGAVVDDPALMTTTLAALDRDERVGAILVVLSRTGRDVPVADSVVTAAGGAAAPILAAWVSDVGTAGTGFDVLRLGGIPTYTACREALAAIAPLMTRGGSADGPGRLEHDRQPVRAPGAGGGEAEKETLDEATMKEWLTDLGLRTPQHRTAKSADEAAAAAEAIGQPVVVKLLDERVPHRARFGLVRINLTSAEAVAAAVAEIEQNARAIGLIGDLRFLVEQFVVPEDGVEWIVGVQNDFRFGPVVAFGLGGVLTEVVNEIVLAPAPLTERQAAGLLMRSRAFRYRIGGQSSAQGVALRDLLTAVGALAHARRHDLVELDLNPVVLTASGDAVILDALGVVRRPPLGAEQGHAGSAPVQQGVGEPA